MKLFNFFLFFALSFSCQVKNPAKNQVKKEKMRKPKDFFIAKKVSCSTTNVAHPMYECRVLFDKFVGTVGFLVVEGEPIEKEKIRLMVEIPKTKRITK